MTLPQDLVDPDEIASRVETLARELCAEIVAESRAATHVGVIVRTATFFTQVKTGKLPSVSTDPDVVAAGARRVLERFDVRRPVRLLGVRLDLAAPP